jgi:hypothetical protein
MSVWTSQRKKYSPAGIAGTSYVTAAFVIVSPTKIFSLAVESP